MDIKLLILDVDGTLTDGGIYYDNEGNELKKFSARDGAGLKIAQAAGLKVMICTGRACTAVTRRASELGLDYCFQNVKNKRDFIARFAAEHQLTRENLAYCGDDWNDLAAMSLCGFVACPADACDEVKARADYICPTEGGRGAVRSAVEELLRRSGQRTDAINKAFGAGL